MHGTAPDLHDTVLFDKLSWVRSASEVLPQELAAPIPGRRGRDAGMILCGEIKKSAKKTMLDHTAILRHIVFVERKRNSGCRKDTQQEN
jgi:hypothetical protein